MNSVDVKSEPVSDQGDDKAFINTLLGEMKSQFNKGELKADCTVKTEQVMMNDLPLKSSPVNEVQVQVGTTESDLSTNENEYKDSSKCDGLPQTEDVPNNEEDLGGKPSIVLLFKKPIDETSPSKNKDNTPGRRSLRNKHSSVDETADESIPKRSSRRRSKDCSESILQSAIARKEKSYNEANKPQRLTRQLKPTPKILENLALAKQEKTKLKAPKTIDKNNQYDSDNELQTSENGLPVTPKKTKKNAKYLKKNAKRMKLSHNVESEKESDSDQSLSPDQESSSDITKNARRSQRLSLSRNKEDFDEPSGPSPNIADQAKDFPDDPECSSVGAELIASRLCLCTQKTTLFADANENDTIFCTAVDSISEKLVGCSREVDFKETPLLRPSQRVPYLTLCDLHRNRLLRHNCCPTCGIFCTQGKFVECDDKHQYHRNCQISVGSLECCPHCGLSTPSRDIVITMQCSKKPVFLPVQKNIYSSAKMSFPIINESSVCTTPSLLPIENIQISNTCELNGEVFSEHDLLEALREGDIDRLVSIIASDTVDLHLKILDFNNGNLLHYAAHQGLLAICHLLVTASVEMDDFDKEQNTPLMLAIISNKNDVVQYLIKAGASITIKGTDGMTALHIAAKCGNLAACQILLRAAAAINNFVNSQDDGGWTPLVWACEHGYVDVANFLIVKGADPSLRDVEHNEALHWAAFSGSSNIVELLLNRGCDANTVNAHGESPLHIAAREDRYNCIVLLLARGASVTLVNKNNETPIDCLPEEGESYNLLALNLKMQPITGTDFGNYKTVLSNDISRGREVNPIQCVNAVDSEPEPRDYVYITKNCRTSDSFHVDTKITSLHTCSCGERCVTDDCQCSKLSMKCWYDEEGKLTPDFNFADPPLIFECNEACACNAITCRNRVVQKGLQQRFQLYKTETRGWGVKTLRFIPKGSYVCEYVGEILTDVLADQREDDSFLFDLDNRDSESFCIDAKYYGNFSRFINHCCNPNLHPVKVFVDHQDLHFPRIAFFAKRDIAVDEELSFDYGHKFWLVKYKSLTCQCGIQECKYSDESIQETLVSYRRINTDGL